jgi:Transposase IS4
MALLWSKRRNQHKLANDNHGTMILKYLVQPWLYRPMTVCTDSYFASVNSAEALLMMVSLQFIGFVKTATRPFPLKDLSERGMFDRGERYGLVSTDSSGKPKYLTFVFVYRTQQYFIATAGSLDPGEPCKRTRWRQFKKVTTNITSEQLKLEIPQQNAL